MNEKKFVFKRLKFENITVEEMRKHLAYCRKYKTITEEPRHGKYTAYFYANVEEKMVNFSLTYRKDNKTVKYICRLDGAKPKTKVNGLSAFSALSKTCGRGVIPRLQKKSIYGFGYDAHKKITWNIETTKQHMWYNEELSGKRYQDCYGYDINSAFSYAMLQPIPDTTVEPKMYCSTSKGEIGFTADGEVAFEPGIFCLYVFPSIPAPDGFKRFIAKWYNIKKKSKNEEQRNLAKGLLNYAVGYMQRVNPFIRNCIVARSNNFVKSFEDDNTLYSNTDSIVSRVRRPDIESNLGPNIGQWKLEHHGAFAFRDFTYQWNFETPNYRGIPKKSFKDFEIKNGRKWDLLTDQLPARVVNGWYYDSEKKDLIQYEEEADETYSAEEAI